MNQPRPATVTVAFALQIALVGVLLLLVGTTVAEAIHYDGIIDRAALATSPDPGEVSSERSFNVVSAIVAGFLGLALAVWLAITAIGMRRGSNVARVLALVGLGLPLLGLGALCAAGGLVGLAVLGIFLAPIDESGPPDEEFGLEPFNETFYSELDRLNAGGWSIAFEAVDGVAMTLGAMLAVAVAVLLLVGPTNRFFRPSAPRPPVPVLWYPLPPWSGHPRP